MVEDSEQQAGYSFEFDPAVAKPEALGHLIARSALVAEILSDDRWSSTFAGWARDTGLAAAAGAARLAREREYPPELVEHRGRVVEHLDAHLSELIEGKAEELIAAASVFVRKSLNLRYRWVPIDIVFGFLMDLRAYALRRDLSSTYVLEDPPSPAQVGMPAFVVGEDESPEEALHRLDEMVTALRSRLKATATPRDERRGRRMPKGGGKHIREYTRWFYRDHTRLQSITSLAGEYHERCHPGGGCSGDDRRQIKYGIARARRLLAVAPGK